MINLPLFAASASAQKIKTVDECYQEAGWNQQGIMRKAVAFAVVDCFNRSLQAVDERKQELEDILEAVAECRGRQRRDTTTPYVCAAKTPLGITDKPTQRVSVVGASCAEDWNYYAEGADDLIRNSCDVAEHPYASLSDSGEPVIRMKAADPEFLDLIADYFYFREAAASRFDRFNGCFASCVRDRFPDVHPSPDYDTLREFFNYKRKRYRDEELEATYKDVATNSNVIQQHTEQVLPDEWPRLACREPK